MRKNEGVHRMVAWDAETEKHLHSFRESLGASDCGGLDEAPSVTVPEGESSLKENREIGTPDREENWSGAGTQGKQGSSEEESKPSDLRNKPWRSPSWGSHSAPSSPRHLHPITPEDQPTRQNIPFPLTPHPQQSARRRPAAIQKTLGAAGSSDEGREWVPPTPGRRREISRIRNGLDIKLDLCAVQRSRDRAEPTETQLKRDKFAFFDKDCSRVAEHIYLGSDAVARNKETLIANKITHVLNCVGFVCPECFPDDFKYKTLWLQDSPGEDITSILYDVFDYFEEVRDLGGRVFVHCCQGVSRSTSLVIAYLMWRKGRSFEDAFQDVKAARGVTNPNMGFACQLLQCQKRVHAAPVSPNSVLRMYRMAPHSPYDPLHLVPKTVSNPGTSALDSRGAFVVHIPSAIYVWVGKCSIEGMYSAAKTAAIQVVKYERAQGKIFSIREGNEPPEFWEVLNQGCASGEGSESSVASTILQSASTTYDQRLGGNSGVHCCHEKSLQHVELDKINAPKELDCASGEELQPRAYGSSRRSGREMRVLKDYDVDYEVYRRALEGGVFPPSNGLATHVPARDSGWSRLRRQVFSGCMRDILTPEATSSENSSQSLGFANLTAFDELSGATRSLSARTLADPFSLSVGTSVSTSCTESPSVSIGRTSSPCVTISNTPRESSFAGSPSSSQLPSPALTFSFSTPLQTNILPNQLDSKSPSKAPLISLAQRRGSAAPSLRLPALIDDPSTPKGPLKSLSPPYLPSVEQQKVAPLSDENSSLLFIKELPNLLGSMLDYRQSDTPSSTSNTGFQQVESHGILENQSSEAMVTIQSKASSCMPRTGSNNPKIVNRCIDSSTKATWQKVCTVRNSTEQSEPEIYAWPSMEKVDCFDADDLDSQAAFVLLAPSGRHSEDMSENEAHVYVWVGKNLKGTKESPLFVEDVENPQSLWEKVGKEFLERSKLQVSMPLPIK
ncbi:hypothetical protein O6H91_17G063700 [Diphasiastrum complanatum]|nr:hypothetical protein O6H91_17G063700 [Diphasiastrum complanatum]